MKTIVATILGAVIYLSTIPQSPVYAAKKGQEKIEQQKKGQQKQQPSKPAAVASHHSSSSSSCSECCKKCALPLVAACGNTSGILELPAGTTAIPFEDNVFPPVGVQHPVIGDTSQFKIRKSGMYLIEWNLTLYPSPIGTSGSATIQLYNASTGDVIESSVHQVDIFIQDYLSVCGQCLVHLTTGTLMQLEVDATLLGGATALLCYSPTITFTLVAQD